MGMLARARLGFFLFLVALPLLTPLLALAASHTPPRAAMLTLDGTVDPNRARYLHRAIRQANEQGASFIVLSIDTPGGLIDAMLDMVQSIEGSAIPVITFVAPKGARAASAGMFVSAAGHVAAMAPATNIGAATPISGSGENLPDTLASKAANDAAAKIRSIAEQRGRNAEPYERAIYEAASYSANQALKLGIIDLIAEDTEDLLAQLHGRTVGVGRREVTLDTAGIRCVSPTVACATLSPSFLERMLAAMANPVVSTLMLMLGVWGIIIELGSPGLVLPGVAGTISLMLALVALGNLPVNWVGVGLIVLAGGLFLTEVYVPGFGVFGASGIAAFIAGGLLLFSPFTADPPTVSMPQVHLSPWLIGGLSGGFAALTVTAMVLAWRGKRESAPQAERMLTGMTGVVTQALDPAGVVHVDGEDWTGEEAHGRHIAAGRRITVVEVRGLTLIVASDEDAVDEGRSKG